VPLFKGCWDVFAWDDVRFAFVEVKRSGKDRLKPEQATWFREAIALSHPGLAIGSFAVVQWAYQ
jgi:hypothetical protein